MSLASILGDTPIAEFLNAHYEREPLLIPQGAHRLLGSLTPASLEELLFCSEDVASEFVDVFKKSSPRP